MELSWVWGFLLGLAAGTAAHFVGPMDLRRLLQERPARRGKLLVWGSLARSGLSLFALVLSFVLFRRAGAILATLAGVLAVRAVSLLLGVRAQRGRGR